MRKIYLLLTLSMIVVLLQIHCKKLPAEESGISTVYYLVSEIVPNHYDSYILPLTGSDDILIADRIIDGSERIKIIVAEIDKGSGDGVYLNKDLVGPDNRIWSWHILKFENFADVTAEIYDGWPGYLEENLDNWLITKDGIIGFWNYTIIRRVDISELQ